MQEKQKVCLQSRNLDPPFYQTQGSIILWNNSREWAIKNESTTFTNQVIFEKRGDLYLDLERAGSRPGHTHPFIHSHNRSLRRIGGILMINLGK